MRDLPATRRWVAVAFAAALLLAPVLAFARIAPDWAPYGDPALMGLRSLDVGTSRTPVVGQPSTSDLYVEARTPVMHPGPTHFYLMAVPVRVLGSWLGMLSVSVVIVGASLVISAWAVFRQLGPPAGILACVALGAITFTTGTASLIHPVSSNIAGYPLLCSVVLLWCVVCGDLRLLPLAAVFVSFTIHQHLAVGLSVVVSVLLAGALVVWRGRRRWRDPATQGQVLRWGALAGALTVLLWLPLLLQELFGVRGNLSAMLDFAGNNDRATLGFGTALHLLANVVGLPPLLGQQDVNGYRLLEEPSLLTWFSAALVVALVAWIGFRARATDRRRTALALMVGVTAVAGLVNGASVPDSIEAEKLSFYHWVWPLTLLVVVLLGLPVIDAVRHGLRSRSLSRRTVAGLVALGALVTAFPSVANRSLDRDSSSLSRAGAVLERHYLDDLVDQVMSYRDDLDGQVAITERGPEGALTGIVHGVGLELVERGVDVRFPPAWRQHVHRDRMSQRDELDAGLVVLVTDGVGESTEPLAGELIAEVRTADFDNAAYGSLVDTAEAVDEVVLGEELEAWLATRPPAEAELWRLAVQTLPESAPSKLVNRGILEFLRDHPPERPALDPELIDRVLAGLPDTTPSFEVQVYYLERDELMAWAGDGEVGRS